MTQKDKELLLKDLCARLPYGVKIEHAGGFIGTLNNLTTYRLYDGDNIKDIYCAIDFFGDDDYISVEYFRPYLFPLSSMNEEQKKEISKRYNYIGYYGLNIEITNHSEGYWDNDTSCNLQDYLWLEDWYNKNHFDYRGLIEKSLAIDATGLNIY